MDCDTTQSSDLEVSGLTFGHMLLDDVVFLTAKLEKTALAHYGILTDVP